MQLKIPVCQQITLPDNWQECQTPQELSYWIIAKFETLQDNNQANATAIEEIREALTAQANQLQDITRTNNRQDGYITTAQNDIEEIREALTAQANQLQDITRTNNRQDGYITTAQNDIVNLQNAVSSLNTSDAEQTIRIDSNTSELSGLRARVKNLEDTPPGATQLYIHTIEFYDVGGSSENTYLYYSFTSANSAPYPNFAIYARQIGVYTFTGYNQTTLPEKGEIGFFIGVTDETPSSIKAKFSNGVERTLIDLPFYDTVKAL